MSGFSINTKVNHKHEVMRKYIFLEYQTPAHTKYQTYYMYKLKGTFQEWNSTMDLSFDLNDFNNTTTLYSYEAVVFSLMHGKYLSSGFFFAVTIPTENYSFRPLCISSAVFLKIKSSPLFIIIGQQASDKHLGWRDQLRIVNENMALVNPGPEW